LEGGTIPSLSSPSGSPTSKPENIPPASTLNPTQPQTQIPNPWDAKIPTVESLVMGGRR